MIDTEYMTDKENVGTSKYQGIAPFWDGYYKHNLRPATQEQKRTAHTALLDAGLEVDGVSDRHSKIIYGVLYAKGDKNDDVV